jgi:hypothetical protein
VKSLVLMAIVLFGLGSNACGGSTSTLPARSASDAVAGGGERTATSSPPPVRGYLHGDDDGDLDTLSYFDDWHVRGYGHAASTSDRRAVEALVKRYYATAAAGDGATACSLMTSRLARSSDLGEVVEETYPFAPNVPPLDGKSCVAIMSLLFGEDHRRLAADSATVQVIRVRVNGVRGLALLGFRTTPERQIGVEREHGFWRVDTVLDRELP